MHRHGHPEACALSRIVPSQSKTYKRMCALVRTLNRAIRLADRSLRMSRKWCALSTETSATFLTSSVNFRQVSPIAIMKWPVWSDVSWEPDLCFANPLVDIALYICRVDPPPEVACRCCLCADIKVRKSCFVTGPLWVIFSFEPGQLPCEDMIIQ